MESLRSSIEGSQPPNKRQKRKTVACRRCHDQKTKCDGEKPCKNCLQADKPCDYPMRDRKVTVNESYIQQLLDENERLKRGVNDDTSHGDTTEVANGDDERRGDNPLIEKEAWFMPYDPSPIYIGEAACTGFSTRVRQLLVSVEAESHIPRTSFIKDAQLDAALNTTAQWPSRPQAFLLVNTALNTIGKCYHLSPASAVRTTLDRAYQDLRSLDQLAVCKLFILFALGEAYSIRSPLDSAGTLPGLHYFARAKTILRVVPERPKIDHIEILVMFALYNSVMNRRHSAFRYIGSAMRLGLTIGMYQNMAERQLPDKAARQRRVRLWWTMYVLDRMMSSKVGYPTLLKDEDVEVDLPTDEGLTEAQKDDFIDADYLTASISLARIAGGIIGSLYSRRKLPDTFSQRVQAVFRKLRDWVEALPPSMQLRQEDASSQVARHIVMLHLSFNQCVILATRPILLHVFRISNKIGGATEEISQATLALASTCSHSAGHSYRLLMRSWVNGSFFTLDYLSAQYLFASATVLALSSLSSDSLAKSHQNDTESATHLLRQLSMLGNLAASEFCTHLDAVLRSIATFKASRGESSEASTMVQASPATARPDTVTTEMALFGPLVGDFLTQTDTELGVPLLLDDSALDWSAWAGVLADQEPTPGHINIGL
ncbi:putative fungal-specific transcription factor, partial [Aureobasidium melanogenum]